MANGSITERQREFERLLAPVLGPAFGTAYHMTGCREEAEDLVQDAAVRAFDAFDRFQPGTNFRAWFFTIMVNRFRYNHRKRKREPEMIDLEDAPDLYLYTQMSNADLLKKSDDPAHLIIERMSEAQIQAALGALPDEYRVVATLYFMEELQYQEIAEIVGCPVGTVRSRLHRARKLLQKALWVVAQERGLVSELTAEKAVIYS